eukprot:9348272-Karenia_brevis.AAC.1
MYDKDGHLVNSQQDIMNVFADFYEELYRTRVDQAIDLSPDEEPWNDIANISPEEVGKQLDEMRKGKAADRSGMVAEMLLH